MMTSSMVNMSQNAPRTPRATRVKRKDQNDRGALDEDEIKKRMKKFSVEPTALLKRGRMSREAARGRKRDRSRACRGAMGAMGAMGTSGWTLLLPLYWCRRGRC